METNQPVEKKGNNKVLIIVGIILILCCVLGVVGIAVYRIVAPAIQNVNQQLQDGIGYSGIADEQLKTDVVNAIAEHEESETGCSEVSLFAGQVFLSPDQSADGSWTENWQLAVCGESHLYAITFTPVATGGTDFSVTRLDQ